MQVHHSMGPPLQTLRPVRVVIGIRLVVRVRSASGVIHFVFPQILADIGGYWRILADIDEC